VRIDQEQATPHQLFETPSTEGRPATVEPKAGGLSTLGLALLTAGTSWAIAASASIWLVPPYLILMAWLLYPSTGRPSGVLEEADESQSDPLRTARTDEASDRSDVSRQGLASAGSFEEGSVPETSVSPAKARRAKGRPRKVKPAPIEPTEATWLQVAPGQFVRVEAAGSPDPVGPHGSPVGLVEVGETPQSSDSNRDESESPESSQPIGDVESGSDRKPRTTLRSRRQCAAG
jgi:hypothetical protein